MPFLELHIKNIVINVIDLLSMTNIAFSKSDIRRLIMQNGIEMDGNKVSLDTMINTTVNQSLIIKKHF